MEMKKYGWIIICVVALFILAITLIATFPRPETRFRRIFGFNIPKEATIRQYHYYMLSGYTAFDITFEENNFNTIKSLFQDFAIREHAIISDKDDGLFNNLPEERNWYDKTRMEFILGYRIFHDGRRGEKTSISRIVIAKDLDNIYHIIIDY